MKMKHFIPAVAMAMMLTVPAFATDPETSDTMMSTTLNFTMPAFFKIARGTENTSVTAEPNYDYTVLNLDGDLNANYMVYTNNAASDQNVTITATCPHTGLATSAFTGTAKSAYYLVFGNNSHQPDKASVDAAKSPDNEKKGADNPNAITIQVVPTVTKQAYSASGVTSDTEIDPASITGDKIVYTLTNGTYEFDFTCATQAEADTFSTADMLGTYQATITITKGGSV